MANPFEYQTRIVDAQLQKLLQTLPAISIEGHTRHLRWLRDQLGPRVLDIMVVTTGQTAYRDGDGVAIVPAGLLGP